MRWHKHSCVRQLILTGMLSALCSGCGALFGPFELADPTATGTWTGRLLSVTVYDNDGREYQAAALDIESGPRTLRGDTGTIRVEDGNDLPLLCLGVGVVEPGKLGVPVGSKVRVSGRMLMTFALAPAGSRDDNVAKRISLQSPWQVGSELVIQLRGKLRVLKE